MYVVYSQYQSGIIHEAEYLTLEEALENIKVLNETPGYGAWLVTQSE